MGFVLRTAIDEEWLGWDHQKKLTPYLKLGVHTVY